MSAFAWGLFTLTIFFFVYIYQKSQDEHEKRYRELEKKYIQEKYKIEDAYRVELSQLRKDLKKLKENK